MPHTWNVLYSNRSKGSSQQHINGHINPEIALKRSKKATRLMCSTRPRQGDTRNGHVLRCPDSGPIAC